MTSDPTSPFASRRRLARHTFIYVQDTTDVMTIKNTKKMEH